MFNSFFSHNVAERRGSDGVTQIVVASQNPAICCAASRGTHTSRQRNSNFNAHMRERNVTMPHDSSIKDQLN